MSDIMVLTTCGTCGDGTQKYFEHHGYDEEKQEAPVTEEVHRVAYHIPKIDLVNKTIAQWILEHNCRKCGFMDLQDEGININY